MGRSLHKWSGGRPKTGHPADLLTSDAIYNSARSLGRIASLSRLSPSPALLSTLAALLSPLASSAAFTLPHPKPLRTLPDSPALLAHNTRGDMSIPSTAVLGLSGRGIGAPAFSCTATGEERYFCCTLDRCGLGPAPHTVSPRSGKDPSPPSGPSRVLSLAGPLQHHIRRPAFTLPRSHAARCFLCTPRTR